MDRTKKSVPSSCNNDDDDGVVAEETGMDKVFSDLQALKKLYGLLQRLDDETSSKALLNKLLDDATRQALLTQAKDLTSIVSDSVVPFSLGQTTSPKKTDQATTPSCSSFLFLSNKEADTMEQVLSDLEALTSLYRLLHKGPGPADEDLDEASRALLMKILEDATREAVRRQAKMLSGSSLVSPALERKLSTQSDRWTRRADPRLRPVASPRPSLHVANEQPRLRLNQQHSTVSRRSSGLQIDAQRRVPEEPRLARLATDRSSRTALPALHRPSQDQEQRHSSVSLHRFPVAGTSRHGTVARSGTRLADLRKSIRRSSGRGDRCSLERSSRSRSRTSSGRSVSWEMSLGPSSRLRGRATPRHVRAESSSSVRPLERMDSGLSLSTTSRRHGVECAGRGGVAMLERSSSSNMVATIQSRIRPSSTLLTERPRGVERKTSRGRQQGRSDVSSVDMYSTDMSSGSRSSWGASILSASTSPTTASPAPLAFANPYYYPPPVTAPRGIVPPVYAPKVSRSMRRRHRQEILEKRVARLRMLKDKIATMFHHRHDHLHHHLGGGQEAGPSSRSIVHGAGHLISSQWHYVTSMFHHAKGKDKNTSRSRAVVGVPEKRRGGGGHMHALFDAVRRHLKGKQRANAPAGIKLRRKDNRVRANKMHWWQQLRQRRGMAGVTAGRPRHRLGHGFKI